MTGEERLRDYEEALERLGELRVPDVRNMWIEYDKASDTLYIYFSKEEAEESIMVDDDTAVFITGNRLVGIAFYNASKRLGLETPL